MNNTRYDGEGFRVFREDEVNRRTGKARLAGAFFGALGCLGFLIAFGQTGGSDLRQIINEQDQAHGEYRAACEASLERAVVALRRAEAILEAR